MRVVKLICQEKMAECRCSFCNAGWNVGFTALDVEDFESEVMSTFPFDTHMIRVMTVEEPTDDFEVRLS